MRLEEIDLTGEEYYSYYVHEDDDAVDISFQDTEITISSEAFDRLKEEIIGNEEGLARVEFNVATDYDKTPKRETLLKELIKTMDKENSVRKKYNEENVKLSAQMNQNDVKEKLLPLAHKLNDITTYKEKLKAQLKYGEFQ